jgi:hypothetical protein
LLHSYGPHLSSLFAIRGLILPRTALAAENPAPRQQLSLLNRKIRRPQLYRQDRFFWVILSQLWKNWREVLIKPEAVIKWHRQGFQLYWRWMSKATVGRPKIDKEIRELTGNNVAREFSLGRPSHSYTNPQDCTCCDFAGSESAKKYGGTRSSSQPVFHLFWLMSFSSLL